jgi:hypothetical protein
MKINNSFEDLVNNQYFNDDFSVANMSMDNMSPKAIPDQNGFSFSFYGDEPGRKHVHVKKDGKEILFWVESNGVFSEENVSVKRIGKNFPEHEIENVRKIIVKNLEKIEQSLMEFEKRKEFRTSNREED